MKAVDRFQYRRGFKFSTYATWWIRHARLVRDVTVRSPEDDAIRTQLAKEVEHAMEPLSEREREVLRLRYGLGSDHELTLEEIGRRLSVTRERVRQIEAKAIAKMRAACHEAA